MPDAGYLTIGKVVSKLKPSYPDLSISKIRFLEDEGLLAPKRTPGGYRLFSARDIKRIEAILYLQKNRFLPLDVIKAELKRVDDPEELVTGGAVQDEIPLPADSEETLSKLHPIENIPDITGISVSFVRQLVEIGALSLKVSPHGRDLVDGRDIPLIRIADQLRRYGIEPKNLRQYVLAANRESGLIAQALAPFARRAASDSKQRSEYDDALSGIISLTDAFRGELIKAIIEESSEQIGI